MKKVKRWIAVALMASMISLCFSGISTADETVTLKNEDIHIRDAYVLVHEGKYYLYGTRGDAWGEMNGFDVYVSDDLENWEGPYEIFSNDGSFWATSNYWAPECYYIDGSFYFLTTFGGGDRENKGIQVLKSDSPLGPFEPVTEEPITPEDVSAIDATLYEEDGITYMLYSHSNQGIYAVALKDDFTGYAGEPFLLFSADDAPWVGPGFGDGYLTDGPCPYVTEDGELLILWSSFDNKGDKNYNVGIAHSNNGRLDGNWSHEEDTLLDGNCGHCMLFTNLDDELMLAYHSPNTFGSERPTFTKVVEQNGTLILASEDDSNSSGEESIASSESVESDSSAASNASSPKTGDYSVALIPLSMLIGGGVVLVKRKRLNRIDL